MEKRLRLDVRFDKPQIFVHLSRQLSEQIRCDGIIKIISLLDSGTQHVRVVAKIVYKKLDHGWSIGRG